MEYLARVVVRLPLRGGSPSPAPPRAAPAAHHTSRAPRATHAPCPGALPAVNCGLVRFSRPLLHGPLGFHGPHGIRQQGIRAGRVHGQALRMRPRASALQCVELAENLQAPRRSPHNRGKVPAVVAVAGVTAGAAVVAAAATAAVDATEIDPPEGDRWCRGVAVRPPPRPRLHVLPLVP